MRVWSLISIIAIERRTAAPRIIAGDWSIAS